MHRQFTVKHVFTQDAQTESFFLSGKYKLVVFIPPDDTKILTHCCHPLWGIQNGTIWDKKKIHCHKEKCDQAANSSESV